MAPPLPQVHRPNNPPHDIIPLPKERHPLIQHRLAFILQVVPFRHTVFGFQRGECEGARGVLAREDVVLPARAVGFFVGDVEDDAFDCDEGRFGGVGA